MAPPAGAGAGLPDPALNPSSSAWSKGSRAATTASTPATGYYGAFQFSQSTWNVAAQAAGLPYLIGVTPSSASKAEQDTVAVALYALDGEPAWTGDRCS